MSEKPVIVTLEKVREWRAQLAENDANPALGGWHSGSFMFEMGDIEAEEFAALLEFAERALSE